jgi:hypothetical protein
MNIPVIKATMVVAVTSTIPNVSGSLIMLDKYKTGRRAKVENKSKNSLLNYIQTPPSRVKMRPLIIVKI